MYNFPSHLHRITTLPKNTLAIEYARFPLKSVGGSDKIKDQPTTHKFQYSLKIRVPIYLSVEHLPNLTYSHQQDPYSPQNTHLVESCHAAPWMPVNCII